MGVTTKIDWCDSTLNLLVGCDGCELSGGHCYAESLVTRYAGRPGWPEAFDRPMVFPQRLGAALAWPDLTGQPRPNKPWLDGRPRMIFLNDLGDTFTESVPTLWLGEAVVQMASSKHVWLLLTKRPKRLGEFVAWWQQQYCERWPSNVWGGVTVTGPATEDRVAALLQIGLTVRFVSLEPLLGLVDLRRGVYANPTYGALGGTSLEGIHWVIAGGEGGPGARPCHPAWIRWMRDQCQAAGVPFFFKQWGEWAPFTDPKTLAELAVPDNVPVCLVKLGGMIVRPYCYNDGPGQQMVRVGKRLAGAKLDGRHWREMPRGR